MSTIDRPKPEILPPLEAGQRLDRVTFHARYEAMPSQTHAELIGGVVFMPSPVRNDHGEVSGLVGGWLFFYKLRTPGLKLLDNTSALLDDESEPQPDLNLRILPEFGGQTFVNKQGYLVGAPELIIEIARSSRAIDLGAKFEDYQRAGVREYVVVALDPDEVFWFVRRDDRLVRIEPGSDGIYRSEVFPGLWLHPVALYADDDQRVVATLERGLASPEHAAFVARLQELRGHA